jgi:hypothetical protein
LPRNGYLSYTITDIELKMPTTYFPSMPPRNPNPKRVTPSVISHRWPPLIMEVAQAGYAVITATTVTRRTAPTVELVPKSPVAA